MTLDMTGGRFHSRPVLLAALAVTALVAAMLSTAAPARARSAPARATAGVPTRAVAAPVGKLTPRGCTAGTGTAACDLYAMAGTTSLLGSSVPIWGFSTTGAAGSATAPGPVLVLNQGDQVSITVHNQLAGESVSLALPGQAAAAFAGTAGDDTTGVATGASRTYSFPASRAGTFLYEAGHTSNGTRQVAMGLAGALVVLPADGSAYGPASGYPATTYDDDGVLVMTEVDPALNAHPDTFDMRNFAPKYRMFNGKPYPAADPISTDQGHHVLLRYVNAGSQTHAVSVLGGDQVEIAQDGHQLKFQSTITAESVDPGETLDTIVTTPTGPESKLAVYEPAQHLDNNGQNTGDPLQLAFGGLLTFLDTNAPPPSTDGVGPVSSHIALSPNPSDARTDVTVTADLSDATTGGSNVSQAEFVVDDAVTTGVGFGTPMTGGFGAVSVTGAHGTIPAVAATCTPSTVALNCLSAGKHTVYVRALDSAGNWGVVGSAVLNLPKTGPATTNGSVADSPANGTVDVAVSATGDDTAAGGTITGAEYFIDAVGADGTGLPVARNRTAMVVSLDATLTAATVHGLTEGTHHVYLHSKDSLNLWGPPLDIPLVVDLTGPAVDAASVGPNPSNGVLTDKSNPGYLVVSAQISDKDLGGQPQSTIADAEAFLDPANSNPPGGTGLQLIAVDGRLDSTTEAVYGLIPISQVRALTNGTHHVYVRGQDAAGTWGDLLAINLIVDKTAPVLGALTATPNPTNGAATITFTAPVTEAVGVASAEFWLGTTDPGVGRGTVVSVSVVNGQAVVLVPTAGIASGAQRFNIRVKDTAGNWSNAVNTTVTVSRPNGIFANNFEPTDPAWSATTGAVSTTAAAAMPTTNEPGSTRGMQVTMPGGNANQASYRTDNSPSAETGYHARFVFNRNSLTPGNNANTVLTIFEARTPTNGSAAFTVQYRINGGSPQLRTVLTRNTGATVVGNWVNLAAGRHTVQVDWVAATAGSLALKIDGTTVSTQTANTGTVRVETVLLGVTAGFTSTTSGTAYFDSFVSTRSTL
ncbi:MAG TPA: multicopper oxidase domain-containing protein [Jatrophihabitantaceae bacterium]